MFGNANCYRELIYLNEEKTGVVGISLSNRRKYNVSFAFGNNIHIIYIVRLAGWAAWSSLAKYGAGIKCSHFLCRIGGYDYFCWNDYLQFAQ